MNEPAAKPFAKKTGLRRRHVLVGVGAAAGGLAITKALGLYNLPSQRSIPGQTQSPTVAGVDSRNAASRPLHRRARTRAAAGDDAESVPAATGVLMAQARIRGSSSM